MRAWTWWWAGTCVLVVGTGCEPGGGGGADAGPGSFTPLDPPMVLAPSSPGYLVVEPGAAGLAPGDTVALVATLYDSFGAPQPDPGFTWSSADPDIATVVDGRVTAVAPGVVIITVSDGEHGDALAAITVLDPASGPPSDLAGIPAALACDPAFRSAAVGDVVALDPRITDLFGDAASGSVTYRVSGPGAATVTSDGTLTATANGVVIVEALDADGQPLAGSCVVAIGAPAMPCTIGDPVITGCGFWGSLAPPSYFSRPGLSAPPLRAWVVRERAGCGFFAWSLAQESPDALEVSLPGVVTVSGGLLASAAPGLVTVRASIGGVECGTFRVTVDFDVSGAFRATCDNDDEVCLQVERFPDFAGNPGPHPVLHRSRGLSQVSSMGALVCETPDGASYLSGTIASASDVRCSTATPCPSIEARECGRDRHGGEGVGRITGPDTFSAGTCEYTRSSEPCAEGCAFWDETDDWGPSGCQLTRFLTYADLEACFAMFPACCEQARALQAIYDDATRLDAMTTCSRESGCMSDECTYSSCAVPEYAVPMNLLCPGIGDCLCPPP